jgi:transposase
VKVKTLGIDLAKETFGLHGVDARGRVVVHKRVTRKHLLGWLAKLEPCLVGMEACSSAHYWAREIEKLGHTVRLMNPQFVVPYRKGNKNDPNDAEAICEAVTRPSMRFVPIKCEAQQDLQALHRVREQLIKHRTALANQIRGLLRERGIVVAQAIARLRRALPLILEDATNGLSGVMRELLGEMAERLRMLDDRLRPYDQRIERLCQQDERCRRLVKVEGVGPLVATALVAAIGNARQFKTGRELSAWLGLVPRQHSSGQRTVLLGISKRGDRYLRTLLIHGARSATRVAERKRDARSIWLSRLKLRGGPNVAAVALANKNARVMWALLTRNDTYRRPAIPGGQAASGARLKLDRAAVAARSARKGAPSPGSVTPPARLRAARLIPASAAPAPGMK